MSAIGMKTKVATGLDPSACPEITLPMMFAPPYSNSEALTHAASMPDTTPKKSDMKL